MAYKALYRKYRSSTFEEIYGQSHIVKTLQNSIKNNKIGHAYLFCGPRGTGKTSMAKLFAKALNCDEGLGYICNECENCKLINSNSHPDVLELDAASNSSVDDIRKIIEKVKYAPIKGKYKVYIIDEVHMLSNSAFNALLKTLEEPPADVVFILATTEPHKVLPTILSRCQRYDFTKIESQAIKDRLLDIIAKEDFTCEDAALDQIIDLADGGMRDALSILDQLVAYCDKNITYDDVISVFGLVSKNERTIFLKDIAKKNVTSVLTSYNTFCSTGVNIKLLNDSLINDLKDLLIYKLTHSTDMAKSLLPSQIISLSEFYTNSDIEKIINKLLQCTNDFKNIANILPYYEIILINLCNKITEEKQIKIPVETIKVSENAAIPQPIVITAPVVEEKIINEPVIAPRVKEIDALPKTVFAETISEELLTDYSDELLIKAIVKSSKDAKIELFNKWNDLPNIRNKENAKVIDALNMCKLFSLCDELLILQTSFKTVRYFINNKNNTKDITSVINTLCGKSVTVFAIDYERANILQTTFLNLRQVNKLPKESTIGKLL
ncbi:MAG: DNA polymerase III subunit gamma/tau [Bacilli bacterium]